MYVIKTEKYTLSRDYIRLSAITYQVCDLDKKITASKETVIILVGDQGLEPGTH